MKLSDIILSLSKDEKNENSADMEALCQELGVHAPYNYWEEFGRRLKGYYIESWLCTDTTVGACAYFLDEEFVFLGIQTSRKSGESFSFKTKGSASKVRQFLLDLIDLNKEETLESVDILNLDDDVEELYSVPYSSQIQNTTGFYKGLSVEVVEVCRGYNTDKSRGITMNEVRVKVISTGEILLIPCYDYKMKINIGEGKK